MINNVDIRLRYLNADGTTWTNIINATSQIQTKRAEFETGTFSCTVHDSAYDPMFNSRIFAGVPIWLEAKPKTTWITVFLGKISSVKTSYNKDREPDITISAVDVGSVLFNRLQTKGVSLPQYMGSFFVGTNIAYNVNGSTSLANDTTHYTITDPDATLADQISLVRNAVKGYVWIDKSNVFRFVSTSDSLPTNTVWFSDTKPVTTAARRNWSTNPRAFYNTSVNWSFGNIVNSSGALYPATGLGTQQYNNPDGGFIVNLLGNGAGGAGSYTWPAYNVNTYSQVSPNWVTIPMTTPPKNGQLSRNFLISYSYTVEPLNPDGTKYTGSAALRVKVLNNWTSGGYTTYDIKTKTTFKNSYVVSYNYSTLAGPWPNIVNNAPAVPIVAVMGYAPGTVSPNNATLFKIGDLLIENPTPVDTLPAGAGNGYTANIGNYFDGETAFGKWDGTRFYSSSTYDTATYMPYTAIDAGLDTDRYVTLVTVTEVKDVSGALTETKFGPYYSSSVGEYGERLMDIRVASGVTDKSAYAQDVMKVGFERINGPRLLATAAVDTDSFEKLATLDILDGGGVLYSDVLESFFRVTSIEHHITPGKWLSNIGFNRRQESTMW